MLGWFYVGAFWSGRGRFSTTVRSRAIDSEIKVRVVQGEESVPVRWRGHGVAVELRLSNGERAEEVPLRRRPAGGGAGGSGRREEEEEEEAAGQEPRQSCRRGVQHSCST